jgi:RimJ/RimL family protein N-acetyltransferase
MERTPTIETARLRLRGHHLDDFRDVLTMWRDPLVTRFIGQPSSEAQAWSRLLGYIGHWEMLRYGMWVVEDRESGRFLGELGFADFKRDIDASMRGVPEAGWVFASHAHGSGYATEALTAALAWRDRHLDADRTVCVIATGNLASIRVAEKAGFTPFRTDVLNDTDIVCFERLTPAGVLTG